MSQAGHSLSPEHINIQTTITAHTHQAGRQAGTKGPSASLLSVHSQLESVSQSARDLRNIDKIKAVGVA